VSGFEVSRRLKAARTTRRAPIIFLTSVAQPVTLLRGLGPWPVDYLTKPIEQARLLELVERAEHARENLERLKELGQELRAASTGPTTSGPLALRRVQRQLTESFERLQREGVPAAQLRLTVDGLRQIGRGGGRIDRRALTQKVSDLIRESTRIEDLVASDDGRTFTILLAAVTPMAARLVGEKLRAAVEEKPFRIGAVTVRLLISLEILHSDELARPRGVRRPAVRPSPAPAEASASEAVEALGSAESVGSGTR
jgi:PleD family two-component response regulator